MISIVKVLCILAAFHAFTINAPLTGLLLIYIVVFKDVK